MTVACSTWCCRKGVVPFADSYAAARSGNTRLESRKGITSTARRGRTLVLPSTAPENQRSAKAAPGKRRFCGAVLVSTAVLSPWRYAFCSGQTADAQLLRRFAGSTQKGSGRENERITRRALSVGIPSALTPPCSLLLTCVAMFRGNAQVTRQPSTNPTANPATFSTHHWPHPTASQTANQKRTKQNAPER